MKLQCLRQSEEPDFKTLDNDDSANWWAAQLTYGKAVKSQPGTWSAWVEYLNVEDEAYLGGSTNSWRFDSDALNNIKTWGVGGSYVVAKNTLFNVYQSFGSKWKTNKTNADDPEEQTRAEFVFSFYVPRLQKNLKKACALLRAQAFFC